jgi:hypothetical protein
MVNIDDYLAEAARQIGEDCHVERIADLALPVTRHPRAMADLDAKRRCHDFILKRDLGAVGIKRSKLRTSDHHRFVTPFAQLYLISCLGTLKTN